MSFKLVFLYFTYFSFLFYSIYCNKPLTQISSISPKIGYISDLSALSKKKCFDPKKIIHSDLQEVNHIDTPLRFFEMINTLKLGDYFSSYHYALETDYFSTYLNYIKDNDYSFSINYFSIVSKYIKSHFEFEKGTDILTKEGKAEYAKNSYQDFQNICGDRLIDSFEVGIGLFFSIKLHFINNTNKNKFLSKFVDKIQNLNLIIHQIEYISGIAQTKGYLSIYGIQMNSKDNFLNSKVKGFELCKSTSLYRISDECKDWVSFMTNYLHHDFTVNIKSYVESSFLSELEPLLHFNIGLNVSNYIELNKHESNLTPGIIRKRSEFVKMTNKYKNILNRLINILELSPFRPIEVVTYKGNIRKYLQLLSENDKVINCIFDINNSEKCLQEIMDSALSLEDEIGEFLTRFNELKYFKINLENSYCLPKLLSWESPRAINFQFFYDKKHHPFPYLSINEGDNILCQRVQENTTFYSVNCTESIIPMQFYLEKHDNGSLEKSKLICRNDYLDYEEEIMLDIIISNNSLGFNITDIESSL